MKVLVFYNKNFLLDSQYFVINDIEIPSKWVYNKKTIISTMKDI